jgi:hypothetical protein
MKRRVITVSVTKTIQVVQFEPVVVEVTESAEVESGEKASEVRTALYESASKAVKKFMKEEIESWKRKSKS